MGKSNHQLSDWRTLLMSCKPKDVLWQQLRWYIGMKNKNNMVVSWRPQKHWILLLLYLPYTLHTYTFTHISVVELNLGLLVVRLQSLIWLSVRQMFNWGFESQICLRLNWSLTLHKRLLASLRSRGMNLAAVHRADVTGQTVAVHFIWFWINAHTHKWRGILFGEFNMRLYGK